MVIGEELELWAQKFEAYAHEPSGVQDIVAGAKKGLVGARANSVGNRLNRITRQPTEVES